VKTITGYADKISARPGETITFFVSSELEKAYTARLVRLIHGDTSPDGPGYKDEAVATDFAGVYRGMRQVIHAGSFGIVEDPLPLVALSDFTVSAVVMPTAVGWGEQVVIAHWDDVRGFQLVIDGSGAAAIKVGDGHAVFSLSTGSRLECSIWYVLIASYQRRDRILSIRQFAVHPERLARSLHAAAATGNAAFAPAQKAPLCLAARPGGKTMLGGAAGEAHFNGKLEAPRIFSSALPEILAIGMAVSSQALRHPALVAAWDFSVGIDSETLRDASPNGLHGRTVNMPTRAVTGHNWTGEEMNWSNRPEHYGAIHFHDDDLYDAGWVPSFTWRVPQDIKSAIYCVHLQTEDGEDFVPFAVRAQYGKPSSPLAFLMPTASYMAYGNERCATDRHGNVLANVTALYEHDHFLASHREYGLSLYDRHSDQTGVAYTTRLRPLLNMRPQVRSWLGGAGSAVWQFNADSHITSFLEAESINFDVLTDEDLHNEGVEALAGYLCVMTGTHPEYYSTPMMDAIEGFKSRGGRLMYMGGNGFYWRVAFHRTAQGILEVRRAESGIRSWAAMSGEYYHSFSAELGGLWQRLGRPPQSIVGVGMTSQGFDRSTYFRRTHESYDSRVTFAFEGVDAEIIGDFGLIGGGAAGSEIDRADAFWGTPRHALVVARSENHSDAYLMTPEDIYEPSPNIGGAKHPLVHADMTFFETPAGGAVFSMSSIAWAGSLSHDGFRNNVAQITRNVIRRFVDPAPFATP
jgi:N,N-dimethylformamidase